MSDEKALYCLKTEGYNFFKIGITSQSMKQRIASIQGNCPYKLELVFYTPTLMAREIEKCIRKEMPDMYRTNGGIEWFRIKRKQMIEIIKDAISRDGAPKDGAPIHSISKEQIDHYLSATGAIQCEHGNTCDNTSGCQFAKPQEVESPSSGLHYCKFISETVRLVVEPPAMGRPRKEVEEC